MGLFCVTRLKYVFLNRAQSVRRTSLRDKTLTTKKDAVEETRLRLQAQEVRTLILFIEFGCLSKLDYCVWFARLDSCPSNFEYYKRLMSSQTLS